MSKYKVLFVPGMFSKPIHYVFGTYFADQIDFLKEHKVEWEVLKVSTERSILETREQVRVAIETVALKNQKAILFTHSKGGVDVLEALIHYPQLRSHVRSFIALQSPFFGSPIADTFLENRAGKSLARAASVVMNGNFAGMIELSTTQRLEYMMKNRRKIRDVVREVDILCIAGVKDKEPGKIDSVLKVFRDAMSNHGIESDGLVPARSAVIPGARFLQVRDLDHASAVVRRTPLKFNREEFSQMLFTPFLNEGAQIG